MSLYQLHRAIFDFMRAGEVKSGAAPDFDVNRYDLTDEERKAFDSKDIAALYHLGLHPVLLNGYCRAVGYGRDDYRSILGAHVVPETRTGRWHKNRLLSRLMSPAIKLTAKANYPQAGTAAQVCGAGLV
jgi:hypothetical protein